MSVERGEDPWLLQGTEWPLLFSYRMVTGYQGTPIKIELSGRATAHVNQEDGTVCRSQIDQSGGSSVSRLDVVMGN